jgi:long-chain acyl-CoA synthetase
LALWIKQSFEISSDLKIKQIKKFTLLDNPFSQEKGEITPTLKLRRKILMQNYSDAIEAMYAPV